MKNMEEIINKRFGRLIIIRRVEKPKHIKNKFAIYYLCKCDCGNETIICRSRLINGHTKSCGCYKKEKFGVFKDLTGQKFGRLLVIKRASNTSHNKARFLCKCDCGNEKVISSAQLIRGDTFSCGCYHKEISHLHNGEASFNSIYASYKQGAKVRNLVFSLSKEKFLEIITQNCFYCGIEPSNVQKSRSNNGDFIYNGIDRVDSNKGYIENNIVPCCWKCNKAKNKMNIDKFYESVEELYEWINKVHKYQYKNFK
jgi:hypothetical protein